MLLIFFLFFVEFLKKYIFYQRPKKYISHEFFSQAPGRFLPLYIMFLSITFPANIHVRFSAHNTDKLWDGKHVEEATSIGLLLGATQDMSSSQVCLPEVSQIFDPPSLCLNFRTSLTLSEDHHKVFHGMFSFSQARQNKERFSTVAAIPINLKFLKLIFYYITNFISFHINGEGRRTLPMHSPLQHACLTADKYDCLFFPNMSLFGEN